MFLITYFPLIIITIIVKAKYISFKLLNELIINVLNFHFFYNKFCFILKFQEV